MFHLNDTAHWACFEHYLWFDYLEANCLRKFQNGIQILEGPAFFFFFFLSYWLKHAKYCSYIISNTLQMILVWKGGVWGGCAPSEAMKTLQFSNLICAIWCILFGNIPKRRKDHHLDSLFSDNLNRIDIKVQLW